MARENRRWTKSQKRAITERGGDILVSAAAGSGKTSVLVERVIQRLLDPGQPIDLDRLLVVTFTEAAAGEMKERIRRALMEIASAGQKESLLAERQLRLMGGAAISTLHAFCLQLMRRYFFVIDLDPRFRVMDDEEAELLKQDVLAELFESLHQGENEDTDELLYHYGGGRDDQALREIIRTLHDYLQSLPDGDAWLKMSEDAYAAESPEWEKRIAAWQESIFEDATVLVENALSTLAHATHIASLPAGPTGYIESFEVARETIENVARNIEQRDWEGTREALTLVTWPRRKTGGDSDGALRDESARAWNAAKSLIGQNVQRLFAVSLDEFKRQVSEGGRYVKEIARIVRMFGDRLNDVKRRLSVVDFADLERFSLLILEHPDSPALEDYAGQFEELFIDEYQDINPIQHRLLALLSRTDGDVGNRFMVGDVKQSIYRFRLADPRIFLAMQQTFSFDGEGGKRRIDLSSNFRSHPMILSFVNFIFRQVMHPVVAGMEYDAHAELIAGRNESENSRSVDGIVELHLVETDPEKIEKQDESMSVAGERLTPIEIEAVTAGHVIKRLINEGFQYGDIAILMRSPRSTAGAVTARLEEMGIPAYSHAGIGFYKAVEVELILSLLRLIDNPRQDVPLAGVLRSPIGDFNEVELAQMRENVPKGPFHEAVFAYAGEQSDQLAENVRRFLDKIDAWRTIARRIPLSRLIRRLYEETGYAEFAAALSGGARKEANLNALYEHALAFDRDATRGLERFIAYVDELDEAGKEVAPPPTLGEGENVVSIMSVHKSKGLEFPVVIVLNPDRSWSTLDTQGDVLFDRDLGIAAAVVDREKRIRYPSLPHRAIVTKIRQQNLAEEMRLLYVALTRAKDRLIVVSAVNDLQSRASGWAPSARECGWGLPVGFVATARSWLDWIGLSVARHAQGEALRTLGAGELGPHFYQPADQEVLHDDLSVIINLWTEGIPGPLSDEQSDEDGFLDDDKGEATEHPSAGVPGSIANVETAIAGGNHKLTPDIRQQLDALHNWTYRYESDTLRPAKVSVTELARLDSEGDELADELPETNIPISIPRLGVASVPKRNGVSITAGKTVDPRLKGIATHRFLSKIDLLGSVDATGLQQQLTGLEESGVISSEEAATIDVLSIARFFNTDLGSDLIRSARPGQTNKVWRELPFTMRTGDEATVVQGTIDCLFRANDQYTLVDFKTDRIRAGDEPEAAMSTYQRQVRYYADFVSAITKGASIRAYLVFLHTGRVLQMDVSA